MKFKWLHMSHSHPTQTQTHRSDFRLVIFLGHPPPKQHIVFRFFQKVRLISTLYAASDYLRFAVCLLSFCLFRLFA